MRYFDYRLSLQCLVVIVFVNLYNFTSALRPYTPPLAKELIATAKAMSAQGKGILAADESTGTIGRRFSSIKLENNEENRRRYRQMLFQTDG